MSNFKDWVISVVLMLGLLYAAEPVLWRLFCTQVGKYDNDFQFSYLLWLHWLARAARIAILIMAPVIAIAYLFGSIE